MRKPGKRAFTFGDLIWTLWDRCLVDGNGRWEIKSYDCPFKRAQENQGKSCKRERLWRSHHTHSCSKSKSQWCPKVCLVPHPGQRRQVGLPDFGSRCKPRLTCSHRTVTHLQPPLPGVTAEEPRVINFITLH